MDMITALAVVIGLMGGAATFVILGPIGDIGIQIWAVFVAWGCFFHCGGKEGGLMKTIICGIWGAVCCTIALQLLGPVAGSLGVPLGAGVLVGATVILMILGAKVSLLSAIPASVYGFATTAAFALLSNPAAAPDQLATIGGAFSPIVHIAASFVVGAVLGYVSEKIVGAVVKA